MSNLSKSQTFLLYAGVFAFGITALVAACFLPGPTGILLLSIATVGILATILYWLVILGLGRVPFSEVLNRAWSVD